MMWRLDWRTKEFQRDEMVQRVDEALKMVRMDEFKDREPLGYPVDKKQRRWPLLGLLLYDLKSSF